MNDKQLFNHYLRKMESIHDDDFVSLNQDLKNGQNSYFRMRMRGSSFFNDEWVKKIEDCIYELGQIVNNPLEVTTTEGNLTPIELAKKINYESIQHLASHTQYIKDIDEEGNVVPSKILSQFHKEQLHTYENKFIATFIRRLMLFVEKRYEFIKNTVNFETKDILFIKNKSMVDGKEVEIETKVTIKKENEDAESKIGKEYVKRVELMRRYVSYFYSSPFMKELKTEKNVKKPILQTNIIRKNPYYRKCYETFLFIERFGSLGVEFALEENYQDFNEKERNAMNYILASNVLSLESTDRSKVYKKSKKVYKPKLLSSIDDEVFTYGNLLKGPVEFVRIDEKYTEYLNSRVKKDLPLHPNKVEKEYYKDELALKKNTKAHHKEVDLLLKRIRKDIAKWEKIFEKVIEERNIEEAKEAQRQLELLRKQEHDVLEKKRKEIIAAAHGDKSEIKAEYEAEKKAIEEAKRKAIEEAARKALEEVRAIEEAQRLVEEERLKEEARLAEEAAKKAKEEEAIRVAEEAKALEAAKKAEEERIIEENLLAEETKIKEEAKLAEESNIVEPVAEVSNEEQQEIEQNVSDEQAEIIDVSAENETKEEKEVEVVEAEPLSNEVNEEKEAESVEPESVSNENVSEEPVINEESAAVEETPVEEAPVETALIEEPLVEDKVEEAEIEEQISESEKIDEKVEEKPEENQKSLEIPEDFEKPKAKLFNRKVNKKEPKKQVSKPVEKPVVKEEHRSVLEKIPGRFIVKSNKGYVVSKTEFSDIKSHARVFDDFNDARRYKSMFGGKVIKL